MSPSIRTTAPTLCPGCGASIPAADLDTVERVARCAECGVFFDTSMFLDSAQSIAGLTERALLSPTSSNVACEDIPPPLAGGGSPYRESARSNEPRFKLSLGWRSWRDVPIVSAIGYCIYWVLPWMGHWDESNWVASALIALFGAGLTYMGLARLFNRTTLEVHDGVVRVAHGPFPWRGARNEKFAANDLEGLYCTMSSRRSFAPADDAPHIGDLEREALSWVDQAIVGRTRSYSVVGRLRGGRRVPLAIGLPSPHLAMGFVRELQRRIEKHIGRKAWAD